MVSNRDLLLIEFIEHKDIRDANKLIVVGSLINKNEKNVKSISLEAEFFKIGKFVEECTEYINASLKKGEIENFIVACGGCNDYVPPEYDTYTLTVKTPY